MTQSMKNIFKAFVLVSVLSTTAWAQKSVKVFVTLSPGGDFVAQSSDITGFAELVSPTEVKAKDIKINLNSLKTGMETRDDHMKEKYLETKKFPDAILVSASGKNGKGDGVLKIHGKESKVEGTYTILPGNKFLKAEFKTKISAFGIAEASYKVVSVDDDLKIEIIVPLQSAAGAASAKPAGKK